MSVSTQTSADFAGRFDPERARLDFPILQRSDSDKPLIFLDSAASAQKPQQVIDAISNCYSHEYANIHRGVYELSARATAMFEGVRETAQQFLGAAESREIVFVRSTTEAINLVASSYGRANVGAGDEVLITEMEHHSNIVPWQMLCEQVGATLRVVPIDDRGALIMERFDELLGARTKIVAVRARLELARHAEPDRRNLASRPFSWCGRRGRRCASRSPPADRRTGARL